MCFHFNHIIISVGACEAERNVSLPIIESWIIQTPSLGLLLSSRIIIVPHFSAATKPATQDFTVFTRLRTDRRRKHRKEFYLIAGTWGLGHICMSGSLRGQAVQAPTHVGTRSHVGAHSGGCLCSPRLGIRLKWEKSCCRFSLWFWPHHLVCLWLIPPPAKRTVKASADEHRWIQTTKWKFLGHKIIPLYIVYWSEPG